MMELKKLDISSEVSVIEKLTQVDREATKFDFDKMELSLDTDNALARLDPKLITEASRYSMSEYYTAHLADRRSFFKKLTAEQIMKWSNSLIGSPLLKIPDELNDTACQLFKNLASYMGDRKSSKKPILHIKKHLKLSFHSPEDLKDEAYIQVIRQITGNRDYDRAIRGWNFLAVLASTYAPGNQLYFSLLNYLINEIKTTEDTNIKKRANYIAIRLSKTFEQKRRQVPSEEEILHIENMKSIIFPVWFFSGACTSLPTESYTTVRELKTAIMKKLQLSITRIPYYSLYEICNKPNVVEERFLDDYEKIVDVTAIWARETEDHQKTNIPIDFKIFLKIQLYHGYNENDIDTISMQYVQTCYDVNKGKFNLSENDIVQLAALQLYANFGNMSHEEVFKLLEKDLDRYIPVPKLKSLPTNYWSKKVMDVYTSLKLRSKVDAKFNYLEILKPNPLFETHQFYVKFSKQFNTANPNHIPDSAIIGIKPNGLIICDSDRNEIVFIPYNIIASWGVNNVLFVLVIQKWENEMNKYYFESNQTKMFQLLMEAYTNLIIGKGINEILSTSYDSSKMFDSMPAVKLQKGETARSRSATSYKK